MTKELLAADLSRIVLPTVFRNDYFDALRALSRRNDPSILVRSLEFCLKVTAACSASTADEAIEAWSLAYGFCEDWRHARHSMPNPAPTTCAPGDLLRPVPEPGDHAGRSAGSAIVCPRSAR